MKQQKKKEIAKSAVIGGVVGACFGMPLIGAALGAGYKYSQNDKKSKQNIIRK